MDTIVALDGYTSPIGHIWVASCTEGVVRITLSRFSKDEMVRTIIADVGPMELVEGGPINQTLLQELEGYFSGTLKAFTSRPLFRGTHFQGRVWRALCTIPYGTVKTYGEVAAMIGRARAYRAVGQANGANPLPLLVPCHRVVSRGGLGGYSCGLAIKKWLLRHEANNAKL